MRLVVDNSEAGMARAEALRALSSSLRDLAANLLDLVRGYGSATRVSSQLADALIDLQAYEDLIERYAPSVDIAECLLIGIEPGRSGWSATTPMRDEEDAVIADSLRLAASLLRKGAEPYV